MLSAASQMLLKPLAIDHAGDKLGKKAVEKSGEMIMKKLHSSTKPTSSTKKVTFMKPVKSKPKQEDYNIILNRLISGNGFKK